MFGRLCSATVGRRRGLLEPYKIATRGLSPNASLNESELRAMWMDVYGRIVAPSSSRPSGHPEGSCCARAQNCHLYSALDAHGQEDLRGHPTPTLPHLARALIRLTSTCSRTSFPRVSPAERHQHDHKGLRSYIPDSLYMSYSIVYIPL